jgi:hypothetical protein
MFIPAAPKENPTEKWMGLQWPPLTCNESTAQFLLNILKI